MTGCDPLAITDAQ